MIPYSELRNFESEFRELYAKFSGRDLLIDYAILLTAIDPPSGGAYSSIITPEGQRPTQTAGLIRMGVVASDSMLMMAFDSEDEDIDEEDDGDGT